ncbi:MAG TPA: DUF202 domain-containing protein [Propionibacteriaceae bacterium]
MRGPASPEPPDDIEDRDPGLARERTELAWTRTAISFAALGVAILHTNAVAGVLVLATAVAVWMLGQLSARNVQLTTRPHRLSHRRTVQLITIMTTLMSLLALILALTVPDCSPA